VPAGKGQHDSHLQENAEKVPDVVGLVLGKAFGTVPTLQQESPAFGNLGQLALQLARLTGKHQRRKAGEPLLDSGQRVIVGIGRNLFDRESAPA
jgi:hypothetical protein